MGGSPLRDVAREAHVSVTAVSNFFNHPERLSAQTITAVYEVIRGLDYRLNAFARALRLESIRRKNEAAKDEHEIKPSTLKDVAEAAKLSYQTVSRALNHPETVRHETLSRVRAAVLELDFQRNSDALALRGSSGAELINATQVL